jgi:hypothetical protein
LSRREKFRILSRALLPGATGGEAQNRAKRLHPEPNRIFSSSRLFVEFSFDLSSISPSMTGAKTQKQIENKNMNEELQTAEATDTAQLNRQNKGEVVIEIKTSFKLDEAMLQCLNKEGLTTTAITVT